MSARWSPWYRFCRAAVRDLFFRPMGGYRALHAERVPVEGPLIVAPVHVSFLDPPCVAVGLPRGLRFMAKEELFRFRPFAALITSLGSFPVKRGAGDTEAIRRAIAEIEGGHAVLVFPEGTRNDGETMLPVNRGVAMLAKRTNAPVLPVGVSGTHRCWPRGAKRLRRSRFTVSFGVPLTYAEFAAGTDDRTARDAFSQELARRILEATREAGWPIKDAGSSSGSTSPLVPDGTSGRPDPGAV
ncbi:MAG: 1-acyl-sn-glycerol-3-phosphate acyltransferase [Fimbriimonadaceae bacterium]|nr:1-acyl-sn-glycerol-3-phosphate acyltransferase [Fimbriimonadaceae bacterium]